MVKQSVTSGKEELEKQPWEGQSKRTTDSKGQESSYA